MVIHNAEIIYAVLQKDELMKDKPWESVLRSRNCRGHYVFEDYLKYCFTPKMEEN